MKAMKLSAKALFGIIAIVAVTVIVAAAVIISNTLIVNNTVLPANTGSEIKLVTSTDPRPYTVPYPGDGFNIRAAVTYNVGVELKGYDSYPAVVVKFSITNNWAAIAEGDVEVEYNSGGWTTLTMDLVGSSLVGTFGPPSGFPIWNGYDVTTPIEVTFNVAGNYSTDVWVVTV